MLRQREILSLLSQCQSQKSVCAKVHCSKRTVSEVCKAARATGKSYGELLALSDGTAEWATYYGIEPTACRVRRPRDKGPVEGAVNQLYHYVYARVENDVFHELSAINNRIWELLDE